MATRRAAARVLTRRLQGAGLAKGAELAMHDHSTGGQVPCG
jgi:hypothetical protein